MTAYNIHIGKYIIRKREGYWEAVDGNTGIIKYGSKDNYKAIDGEHLLEVLKAVVLAENLDSYETHQYIGGKSKFEGS